MASTTPLPARCGLQVLPTLQITGVGSDIIATTAKEVIKPYLSELDAPFARQTAACVCTGQHSVILDVGKSNFANLGRLFFIVSALFISKFRSTDSNRYSFSVLRNAVTALSYLICR